MIDWRVCGGEGGWWVVGDFVGWEAEEVGKRVSSATWRGSPVVRRRDTRVSNHQQETYGI